MKDLRREIQPEGLEEAQLEDPLEEEMVECIIPKGPLERNERYNQVKDWSDPVSEGRRRKDVPMYSSTTQSRHLRNIPPPTPFPLEERFFTDWSSAESRSPQVVPPTQSVPIEETSITLGMGDVHEAEQTALHPSQPISQGSHLNATGQAVQVDLLLVQDTLRWPPERSNVPEEGIMTYIGTNTSDVIIEPAVGILRTPHIEATTQTSIPTVEVLIPPGIGDNASIANVSLSILGYEPDSLRTSGIRSPPVRGQEVSMIPQLDGPLSTSYKGFYQRENG